MAGLLSKERIVAGPRFNRWWNVVAALAINLSIGQAYAFSVFNFPLARVLGVSEPLPEDWKLSALGWIFTLAYVFLGLSAGVGGKWQDRVGPRLSGVVAAFCFGSGLFLSALGVWRHQLALLYLGYGVLGGCGLGLGFNTPISILLRWFPDRRGLATGMAIMGFGAGAILAAPLSTALMRRFATSTSVGVAETFVVLGALYTTAMLGGAFLFRLPPNGFRPSREEAGSPAAGLTAEQAVRTRPFPLLWGVLLVNVTAGLGVLGQAAAMIQEVFDGVSAEAAGFFVALLSLFNMGGRLAWAWLSDRLGRRLTYALFFSLGPLLYAAVPLAGQRRSLVLFVGLLALIMSRLPVQPGGPPRGDRPGVGAGIRPDRRRAPRGEQVVSAAAKSALRTGGLVAAVVGAIFAAGLLAGWRLERYDAERGFDAEPSASRACCAWRRESTSGTSGRAPGAGPWTWRAGWARTARSTPPWARTRPTSCCRRWPRAESTTSA
jgi:MFS family permease